MEKEYYIVEGDRRLGPLSISQIAQRGLDPATLVWTAGMADWARADTIPELLSFIADKGYSQDRGSAFGAYSRPEDPTATPYRQPFRYDPLGGAPKGGYPANSTNWKTLAIVATVAGFLFSCVGGIVGIFAWVNASKAENATLYGDDFTARNAWSTCKTLCIVSFVITGIGLVVNILSVLKIFSISNLII